jgi:DNA-binding IclR family transcriptional regulator
MRAAIAPTPALPRPQVVADAAPAGAAGRNAKPQAKPRTRPERGLVKSSARSLQVFEFFEQLGRPARTVEIGRYLDIPNSSADELLKTLAELGYLTFNQRSKCYAPSYRFFNLSQSLENHFFMSGRIGEMMHYLAETTGETVSLAAENRQQLQSMTTLFRNWSQPSRLYNGRRRNLCRRTERGWEPNDNYCSVLLAAKSDAEVIDLVRQHAEAEGTPIGIGDLKPVISTVQEVRRRGYSICRNGKATGIDSVAVALPAEASNVQMAIGLISGDLFTTPRREAELVRLLRQTVGRFLQ